MFNKKLLSITLCFSIIILQCSKAKVPEICVSNAKASFEKLKAKDIEGFKNFLPDNQKKAHEEFLGDHNKFFRTVSDYKLFEDKFEYREGKYFVLTQFSYPENSYGAFFIALDPSSGKCNVDLNATIMMEKKLHGDTIFAIFMRDDKTAKDQKLPPDVDPTKIITEKK